MTRLLICRTCPRYEQRRPRERGRGQELAAQAKAHVSRHGGPTVLAVNCLAGCRNPCNAALDQDGKARLRFSRLEPEHLEDLLAAAELYGRSDDGGIALEDLPPALRDRLSARSPARIGD